MLYQVVRAAVKTLYSLLFRYRISGEENIPNEGGIIFCPNHISNHDAITVAITQKRRLSFMGKDSLFTIPVLGWIITTVYSLAVIVPGVTLIIRRLNDIGKSWPWIFISFVPCVGSLILIVFCCLDSAA